ncbi:MAG: succinylglutamate desuccinylase [Pseudomonadota bacterium]
MLPLNNDFKNLHSTADLLSFIFAKREFFSSENSTQTIEYIDDGIFITSPKTVKDSQHTLIFSCGIHGNETAPIEILSDLLIAVLHNQIQPKNPCLWIFGNLDAIKVGKRFIDLNLNRLFTSKDLVEQDNETCRAKAIKTHVNRFCKSYPNFRKLHCDLHTAIRDSHYGKFAIIPFSQTGSRLDNVRKQQLQAMGIEAVVYSHKQSSTFSSYTALTWEAESYTLELGKVRPFGENPKSVTEAPQNTLRSLLCSETLPAAQTSLKEFVVIHEVIKSTETFKLFVEDDFANFTPFAAHTLIAQDKNYEYRAERDNVRLIFPNSQVQLGHRAGLIIEMIK